MSDVALPPPPHLCLAQAGNLLIPLHGYPVPNAPAFPRRADFGRAAVGDCVRRRLALRCRVPMEFEFAVRVLKRSAAFSVSPAAGVVPAGGATEVEVVFRPVRHATEEMRFEVRRAAGARHRGWRRAHGATRLAKPCGQSAKAIRFMCAVGRLMFASASSATP